MIEQVSRELLLPGNVSLEQLDHFLVETMGPGIDFADLYFQQSMSESWVLEEGIVKDAGYSADRGVGVRSVSGEKTGFSYSGDISALAISQAAQAARSIVRQGQSGSVEALSKVDFKPLYAADNPILALSSEEKLAILQQADSIARDQDSRVKEVTASLSANFEQILVVASDGTLAADIRPLVRVNVSVIAEQNGRRERGSAGAGGRYNLKTLMDKTLAESAAKEAVRQALVNLEAVDAPAGNMPVVLGPGWPGVLLHEAVGHGLEGDFNRKGSSAFSGRMGEQVASSLCTIVDDGTLADRRGSLSVDDEGTPTQNTTLIENGRLVGYMQDKMNARLMKQSVTGNGRRESFAHLPMPRMTNTYMLPGEHAPEELISSVKNGIYAVNFGGGQVDITSGKFVFSASEAYLIENGKVTTPIKGATLIGNGPETMRNVSMVGNDLRLDDGVGVCGKDGQSVPVGVGQPSLKIDELTVGGTGQ
ncbi:metalloprotease TldD [Oceanospirillum linum]|uniref:Metalloprotease TldD n=1 Tax=Oceanospirillum linum TaxID=966 RepID=A0A1T1H9C9_OCELI|nr:metalloprotease TldD [Oceanospirillum linum]OOV86474.1 metalloprotease TldD [Oceanospirillum linum]SEG34513.1 microcin-processing peptidase 2. Unknown type peptidase. MEROPS family U62 [Oleiphilus messinensis]SMP29484.1 microcin-processing peptidase 2. Unknown type peptidase. MEROPS family U62 [Oceanospirillum linum]